MRLAICYFGLQYAPFDQQCYPYFFQETTILQLLIHMEFGVEKPLPLLSKGIEPQPS